MPPSNAPITSQVDQYLHICDTEEISSGCLHFWASRKASLPSLFSLAMTVLGVPATSAPIERVFSHGGIIIRPHRVRLTDRLLSQLVIQKCNRLNISHQDDIQT